MLRCGTILISLTDDRRPYSPKKCRTFDLTPANADISHNNATSTLTFPASCDDGAMIWVKLVPFCPCDTTIGVKPDMGDEFDCTGVTIWTEDRPFVWFTSLVFRNSTTECGQRKHFSCYLKSNRVRSMCTFDVKSVIDDRHFTIGAVQICAICSSWQNV